MKSLIFGVILASLFILSFGMVSAITAPQEINASVESVLTVAVAPALVEFGLVNPSTSANPATSIPITLDAAGSNTDVHVEIAVTNEPFKSGLKFGSNLADGKTYDLLCAVTLGVCTYTIENIIPTLDVPTGSPAGVKTGTITYSFTGTIPA